MSKWKKDTSNQFARIHCKQIKIIKHLLFECDNVKMLLVIFCHLNIAETYCCWGVFMDKNEKT